ncbi:MAG TPA: PD-(D/E)XK nuclease family protein [Steroidobacteraceae bacterium]
MLELTPDLLEHLNRGGTLLVPTAQRAAAVRLAHTGAQLAAGRRVWDSPDVLPFGAWLQRGLDEARMRGVPVPRRLARAEEWLLWRESVRAACANLPVLWPDALIDSVRRAVLQLEDHGLQLEDPFAPESIVLLRARIHFQRRCRELRVLWGSSWSACAPYVAAANDTRLVGFGPLASARRAWLERIGVRLEGAGPEAAGAHADTAVLDFDTPEQEAAAAAEWCASRLRADSRARLLIVVLRLSEHRHRWLRALTQRLDGAELLGPDASHAPSGVAIEGGQPLQSYALVATALNLLTLGAGEADFTTLSALLRSPFLTPSARDARLRIDLWLREHDIEVAQLPLLHSLLAPLTGALGDSDASVLRALLEASDAGAGAADTGAEGLRAHPAQWAQRFAAVLERSGWPGPGLRSDEQQVRARFEELLGEFAAVGVAPRMDQGHALQLLRQLSARTRFEPASDDVPVTLTASLDDPVVRYDGIWVAGLTADAWPAPASPDPLIPWAVQQAAAMPLSSPAAALERAEQAMRDWQRATGALALSWSRSDADLPRDPSALLPATAGPVEPSPPRGFELESWIAAQAPVLESWHDRSGRPWPAAQVLPGGTRLLELQSRCPFRSFAQWRLRAQPLTEPAPGIDPRVRGQILHGALERFWRATGDSRTLHAQGAAATTALVRECVEQALAEAGARAPLCAEPVLLRREGERAERLLLRLMEWERTREPFAAAALEWAQHQDIAGATLRLRLDRLDRLEDGRLIVIDYKSGAPVRFDPFAERPQLPQLPAYALAAGAQTAAVASLYLQREGPGVRGVADRAGRLPRLPALPAGEVTWPLLLQRWHGQLQGLVREFLSGHAAVDPQPGACASCHLQAVCRIDPARSPPAADTPPTPEAP